jgi:SH3 domain-containing YSC84-like protein 1
MKRIAGLGILCLSLIASVWADSGEKERDRIKESENVLKDILEAPDKGVPLDVMDGTKCAIVIPSLKKGAFIFGGSYGRGVMMCRMGENFKGPWSPPIMMATESGSVGFQIGGEGIDVVILVLNDDGARTLMKSKVKLGADASVAAGPVGRTAEASTTGAFKAQMLSYSRSRGVFAGISLSGASLRVDNEADERLYGKKVTSEQIFKGEVQMPEVATPMAATLKRATRESKEEKRESK